MPGRCGIERGREEVVLIVLEEPLAREYWCQDMFSGDRAHALKPRPGPAYERLCDFAGDSTKGLENRAGSEKTTNTNWECFNCAVPTAFSHLVEQRGSSILTRLAFDLFRQAVSDYVIHFLVAERLEQFPARVTEHCVGGQSKEAVKVGRYGSHIAKRMCLLQGSRSR